MKVQQSAVRSVVLPPITAATTARTAILDTQGADYVTFEVILGQQANTNATIPTITIAESDTTASTSFATFSSGLSAVAAASNAATTGCLTAVHIDLKGRRRYQRITVTPDTTTNGAVLSAVVGVLDREFKGANSANADKVVLG